MSGNPSSSSFARGQGKAAAEAQLNPNNSYTALPHNVDQDAKMQYAAVADPLPPPHPPAAPSAPPTGESTISATVTVEPTAGVAAPEESAGETEMERVTASNNPPVNAMELHFRQLGVALAANPSLTIAQMSALVNKYTKLPSEDATDAGRAEQQKPSKRLKGSGGKPESAPTAANIVKRSTAPLLTTLTNTYDPSNAAMARKLGRAHFCVCTDEVPNPVEVGSTFQLQQGWTCTVDMNGGKLGEPSITLCIQIATQASREELCDPAKVSTNEIRFKWRPGSVARSGDHWMIDNFDYSCVNEDLNGSLHQNVLQQIAGSHDEANRRKKSPFIFALSFSSYGVISQGHTDKSLWAHLPQDVRGNIDRLADPDTSSRILVHFFSRGINPNVIVSSWLEPFKTQVNRHIKPFHLYREADGSVNFGIKSMPTIAEVGNSTLVSGRSKDTQEPNRFHVHEKRVFFDSLPEFAICIGMPAVRKGQFEQEQAVFLEVKPQFMFLQQATPKSLILEGGHNVAKSVADQYYGFFRLHTGNNFTVANAIYPVGTRLSVEFDNSLPQINKPHQGAQPNQRLYGVVIENADGCKETDTAFCALLHTPKGFLFDITLRPELRIKTKPQNLPSHELWPVYLKVHRDKKAVQRELHGVARLCSDKWEPETMGPLRKALMSTLDSRAQKIVNLTTRNPRAWHEFKKHIFTEKTFNNEQLSVIMSLESVQDCFLAVDGPPGTGKTETIVYLLIGALATGHTLLCTGTSNAAVDNLALRTHQELSAMAASSAFEKFSVQKDKIKILRLEVSSSELAVLVSFEKVRKAVGFDPTAPPQLMENEALSALRNSMESTIAKCLATFTDMNAAMKHTKSLTRRVEKVEQALERVASTMATKESKVPYEMSLAWHLSVLALEDDQLAEDEFQGIKTAWTTDQMNSILVSEMVSNGEVTEETADALQHAAITEDAFNAMVNNGKIRSAADRSASREWKKQLHNLQNKGGNLDGIARKEFDEVWMIMLSRVMRKMTVIFVTCNKAGSEMLSLGFRPSIILCDEAAQVTFAELTIPMTQSGRWEATILVGDIRQLKPRAGAQGYNEFINFAEMSTLEFVELKSWNVLRLNMQYRMAPDISQWPAKRFYKGNLKDAPSTKKNNFWRRAMRCISSEVYGLNKKEKMENSGSLYFLLDCEHGLSAYSSNSTSSANTAFARNSAHLVGLFMGAGVPSKDVTVLTYYTAQQALVSKMLMESQEVPKATPQCQPRDVKVQTVDSYQGAENHIIILDLTIGHSDFRANKTALNQANKQRKLGLLQQQQQGKVSNDHAVANADSDEEPEDSAVRYKHQTVSGHLRDPGRLNTALTRAQDGLIVVGRGSTLVGQLIKQNLTEDRTILRDLYLDAHGRGLVVMDHRPHKDTPEYQALTESWSMTERNRQWELEDLNRNMYLYKARIAYTNSLQASLASQQSISRGLLAPKYHSKKAVTAVAPLDPHDPAGASNSITAGVKRAPLTGDKKDDRDEDQPEQMRKGGSATR